MANIISIQLPDDVSVRLEELAQRTGRSTDSFAREAILSYLEDLEETHLALDRIEHPGRRWSMEEIEQGDD